MANELARALRKRLTPAERRLWYALRELKSERFHFRKQAPLGRYILDFVCFEARLVIEVDGGQHAEKKGIEDDAARDAYLTWQGFDVLRFWNSDVMKNISGVMTAIYDKLGLTLTVPEVSDQTSAIRLDPTPTPSPSPQGGGGQACAVSDTAAPSTNDDQTTSHQSDPTP